MNQASLTAPGLQHGLETLRGDELVPLMCAPDIISHYQMSQHSDVRPGQETHNVLRPHDGQQPTQLRLGEGGQEHRASRPTNTDMRTLVRRHHKSYTVHSPGADADEHLLVVHVLDHLARHYSIELVRVSGREVLHTRAEVREVWET